MLGVSADTPEDLARFREKYELNFPLAGDASHQTLEAYGVWQEKNMYGVKKMGVVRTTYILSAAGRVERVFAKVKVDGHIREVLQALES